MDLFIEFGACCWGNCRRSHGKRATNIESNDAQKWKHELIKPWLNRSKYLSKILAPRLFVQLVMKSQMAPSILLDCYIQMCWSLNRTGHWGWPINSSQKTSVWWIYSSSLLNLTLTIAGAGVISSLMSNIKSYWVISVLTFDFYWLLQYSIYSKRKRLHNDDCKDGSPILSPLLTLIIWWGYVCSHTQLLDSFQIKRQRNTFSKDYGTSVY